RALLPRKRGRRSRSRWNRRHAPFRSTPTAWSSSPGSSSEVVESDTRQHRLLPSKEILPMATERPLVVLAGAIHPDGKALLEKETRVLVCEDETEAGLVKMAAE